MTGQAGSKRGFALLAVLWVLVGVAALGILLQVTARDAQGTAMNRIGRARARWEAEGCLARASATLAEATDGAPIPDSLWQRLDTIVLGSPLVGGCRLSVVPVGLTLDVNTASEQQLQTIAIADGMSVRASDSLAAAIMDWLDADDEARVAGAERAWYNGVGAVPPPNEPIGSIAGLHGVRGLDLLRDAGSLLGTEPGRILLTRAPLPVLATLPGFGGAVLASVAERRAYGGTISLPLILTSVRGDARRSLADALPALSSLVTEIPDAWLVLAAAGDSAVQPTVTIEHRVVRSGSRLAVLRRRVW
jgi:hypothetical protein